jgi:hypothetical protein
MGRMLSMSSLCLLEVSPFTSLQAERMTDHSAPTLLILKPSPPEFH